MGIKVAFLSIGLVLAFEMVIAAPRKSLAADSLQYSNTWAVGEELELSRDHGGDGVYIGPSRWEVRSTIGANELFLRETWKVRGFDEGKLPRISSPRPGQAGKIWNNDGWLVGILSPHQAPGKSIYTVTSHAVSSSFTANIIYRLHGVGVPFNIGPHFSCPDDYRCLTSFGGYTSIDYHRFASAISGKVSAIISVVPTSWTVEGKVCEERAACQ